MLQSQKGRNKTEKASSVERKKYLSTAYERVDRPPNFVDMTDNKAEKRPLRIILIGYMGAGKTTVGKALSKQEDVFSIRLSRISGKRNSTGGVTSRKASSSITSRKSI